MLLNRQQSVNRYKNIAQKGIVLLERYFLFEFN